MGTIRLTGDITENGQLQVELPLGLPSGRVEISIEIPTETWTDEELHQLMHPEPMTGSEIVAAQLTGGWSDAGIIDGAAWVQEQRRKRKDQREW